MFRAPFCFKSKEVHVTPYHLKFVDDEEDEDLDEEQQPGEDESDEEDNEADE